MPWEAVNRPAAAKAVMLNAGNSITPTNKLCHFYRLLPAGFFCCCCFVLFIIERENINNFEGA